MHHRYAGKKLWKHAQKFANDMYKLYDARLVMFAACPGPDNTYIEK